MYVAQSSTVALCVCLKKNKNAPRPSEHPPVQGGEMSKRLGWIKGCKYKTCVVIPFILDGRHVDAPAGVTPEEVQTGFLHFLF